MTNHRRLIQSATFLCILIAGTLLLRSRVHASASSQQAGLTTPTLQGDPAHPAQTHDWVETRLYFGLGPADTPSQVSSEAAWRDFLDHEVTPRFPSGLSVVDVYGQWQGQQQADAAKPPSRIRSKMLIIDHPATSDDAAKLEAIRTAWKQRTHEHSVLEVTQPADVSF